MISDYDFQNADILGDRNDTINKTFDNLDNLLEGKENGLETDETPVILQDTKRTTSNLLHPSSAAVHLASCVRENKCNSKSLSIGNCEDANIMNHKRNFTKDEVVVNSFAKDECDPVDYNISSLSNRNFHNSDKECDIHETIYSPHIVANGYKSGSVSSKESGNFTDEERLFSEESGCTSIPSGENPNKDPNHLLLINDATRNKANFSESGILEAKNKTREDNGSGPIFSQTAEIQPVNNASTGTSQEVFEKIGPHAFVLNTIPIVKERKKETESMFSSADKRMPTERNSNTEVQKVESGISKGYVIDSYVENSTESSLPNDVEPLDKTVVKDEVFDKSKLTDQLFPVYSVKELQLSPSINDLTVSKPDESNHGNSSKLKDSEKFLKMLSAKESERLDQDISMPKKALSHSLINGHSLHLGPGQVSNNSTKDESLGSTKFSQFFDDIPSSSSFSSETKRHDCKLTKMKDSNEKNKGLKRLIESNEESQYKRLKLTLNDEKSIKSEVDPARTKNLEKSLVKKGNSDYLKVLEDGLKASSDFDSLLEDRATNPNKLYQGLLNDVLAEEKDGIREPEIVRTKLKKIKRKDLEDIIIDQLMNKVLYDHELGGQRELCKRLEQTLEAANKKAVRLTQEVESLKNIATKVATEHKKRKMYLIHPTKVKRSVGIQANKSYISQGFSSAFLPDSDVRLLTPTKYQKARRNGDCKNPATRNKGKVKPKSEADIGQKKEENEVDYSSVSNIDNLNQKLNTIKENLEASRLEDRSSHHSSKKLKHSKKQAINGKQFSGDTYKGLSFKGADAGPRHPARLPHHPCPEEDILKGKIPPGPILRVHLRNKSIILSWNINENFDENSILSYQLFSYEETKDPPSTDTWQKIGSVKALELPMACTLTQFKCGRVYHFAVRATTKKGRIGPFSLPKSLRMPFK